MLALQLSWSHTSEHILVQSMGTYILSCARSFCNPHPPISPSSPHTLALTPHSLAAHPLTPHLTPSPPHPSHPHPGTVTDLHWLSSFLFAVVYTPQSPANSAPSFVFLSVPVSDCCNRPIHCLQRGDYDDNTTLSFFLTTQKNEAPYTLNFDDVFYGTGTKQSKFYFSFLSKW